MIIPLSQYSLLVIMFLSGHIFRYTAGVHGRMSLPFEAYCRCLEGEMLAKATVSSKDLFGRESQHSMDTS